MYTEIITQLILAVPIIFGNFEYCGDFDGKHFITIKDDIISENRIEVCNGIGDVKFTVIHELGHPFWYMYLSLQQRDAYRALQTDNTLDYYRDYSMSNAREDFADNFYMAIMGLQGLSVRHDNKIKFINDIIRTYE